MRPGVARQQTRLQSILRVIHRSQRLFKIVVRLNRHHRPKDLFVAHFHARLGRGQNCRRRSSSLCARRRPPAWRRLPRLLSPTPPRAPLRSAGSADPLRSPRPTGLPVHHLGRQLHHLPQECLKDAALHKHALHADARLARVAESRMRGALAPPRPGRSSRCAQSAPRCRPAQAARACGRSAPSAPIPPWPNR